MTYIKKKQSHFWWDFLWLIFQKTMRTLSLPDLKIIIKDKNILNFKLDSYLTLAVLSKDLIYRSAVGIIQWQHYWAYVLYIIISTVLFLTIAVLTFLKFYFVWQVAWLLKMKGNHCVYYSLVFSKGEQKYLCWMCVAGKGKDYWAIIQLA